MPIDSVVTNFETKIEIKNDNDDFKPFKFRQNQPAKILFEQNAKHLKTSYTKFLGAYKNQL